MTVGIRPVIQSNSSWSLEEKSIRIINKFFYLTNILRQGTHAIRKNSNNKTMITMIIIFSLPSC